jgi:hypothetical protein
MGGCAARNRHGAFSDFALIFRRMPGFTVAVI